MPAGESKARKSRESLGSDEGADLVCDGPNPVIPTLTNTLFSSPVAQFSSFSYYTHLQSHDTTASRTIKTPLTLHEPNTQ